MKRLLSLIVFSAFVSAWAENESAVEIHYKKASSLRDQGKFAEAIEEVSKGIALNPQETEWFAKSELLSAELYVKLDMLKAAEVTARQVVLIYPGTEFETEAKKLQEEIKQLTEESGQAE